MPVNFPANPVDEDTFVANGITYTYTAIKNRWEVLVGAEADGGGSETSGVTQILYNGGAASTQHINTLEGGTA